MEVITFEKQAYYAMMEELMTIMYQTIRKANEDAIAAKQELRTDLITTSHALRLLGLKSRNRLYELRNAKLIEYYQHGRRVLYSKKSIIKYLESNKIV